MAGLRPRPQIFGCRRGRPRSFYIVCLCRIDRQVYPSLPILGGVVDAAAQSKAIRATRERCQPESTV